MIITDIENIGRVSFWPWERLEFIVNSLLGQKGGISYIPWYFAANFCLLSAEETAFEGFEGDFQRPEFQDAAHPR